MDEIRAACPGLDWHDALFDAVASLLVAQCFVARFGLQDLPVARFRELDTEACARYRALKSLARAGGLDV